MKKSVKVCKMNFEGLLKPTLIFYGIFCVITAILIYANSLPGISGNMSGVDFAAVIFIFVCGLCSFKSNFLFAKANNVSRKSFLAGILMSAIPYAFITAVADLIINRIINIFICCPTLYDMSFGNLAGLDKTRVLEMGQWSQSSSIGTVINTVLFLFFLRLVVYTLGILISMIYYRCNKIAKIIVSITPIILLNILGYAAGNTPGMAERMGEFLAKAFGIAGRNVYNCYLSCAVLFLAFGMICFLLIRNAVVKPNK